VQTPEKNRDVVKRREREVSDLQESLGRGGKTQSTNSKESIWGTKKENSRKLWTARNVSDILSSQTSGIETVFELGGSESIRGTPRYSLQGPNALKLEVKEGWGKANVSISPVTGEEACS